MSDKELLEFAAKAARHEIIRITEASVEDDSPLVCVARINGSPSHWNPLANDGDALRLAVKLSLEIAPACYLHNCAEVYSEHSDPIVEEYGDNPFAATRRAIVRAAAEIGRSQQ